jgi:hypothetical protein
LTPSCQSRTKQPCVFHIAYSNSVRAQLPSPYQRSIVPSGCWNAISLSVSLSIQETASGTGSRATRYSALSIASA